MLVRTLVWMLALAAGALAAAKTKAPPSGKVSHARIEIEAVAHLDKAEIRGLVGDELEGIALIELRVIPRGEEPLAVGPDDFILRSDRDGQRSQPFAPSQIAGEATLVVSSGSSGGGGGIMGQESGPIWGGGPVGGGRPQRLPGSGGAIGNTGGEETVQAKVEGGNKDKDKDNPLLKTLKEKMMPARTGTGPVAGLLYFPLEGKHKPKDLELMYRGPAGKLFLRFK